MRARACQVKFRHGRHPLTLFIFVMAVVVPIACALIFVACREQHQGQLRPLKGGKQVLLLGTKIHKAESGTATLVLDYVTDLPIHDYVALTAEAEELWSQYRSKAETENVKTVMITAHNALRKTLATSFPFTIGDDGAWEKPEVYTLRGGKQIVVIHVRQKEKTVSRGPALFIDYVTDLPIRNLSALAVEVEDVWSEFRERAESVGAQRVYVFPNDAPVGGSSLSFSFTRANDGTWSPDWKSAPASR